MAEIVFETRDGVAVVTLNRPDKLNALAGSMREDLVGALARAGEDETVRAIILTGAGRAFCAGGDIDAMRGMQERGDVEAFRALLDAGALVVQTIRSLPKIVIAMVNGVAAGAGCNLALACDFRIASTHAKLGETFVRIGLHPDWGGTWLLPRLVGPAKALEILATGRLVGAEEAAAIGIVDRLVPPERLEEETMALAKAIADGPPAVIADIKRAVHASAQNDLAAQLGLEKENQLRAFTAEDGREGVAAFSEKRAPKFRGL
ncbi:MAG: enoyl-CoA hydratase/isomerase family protein [Thermoanaerobaculia bacterium]